MNIKKTIDHFIDKMILNSTFDKPYWNIELIKKGKPNNWNHIDGCMTTSLLSLYEQTSNTKYLDFVDYFVDYYIFEDGTIRGFDPQKYSADDLAHSRVLFDLYKLTKKEKYLKAIHHTYSQLKSQPRTKEGNFWHKLVYHDQVWLDGLYMFQPFYTLYETQFNQKNNYLDIINQFKNVRKIMFDENKKLYYQGYDESKTLFWADKKTGLSKHFWLRAMGWYVAALSDVSVYIEDIKSKEYLASLLKEAIDGLLLYQDYESKMFYHVIDLADRPENYLETSGTLLIAYAILHASNNHILDESYEAIGVTIFEGTCKKQLTEVNGDLNLENICLSVGLGPESNTKRDGTFEYYISEPIVKNDAKGVGPLVMAYVEYLKISK
ncbi:(Glycosyl hydrolase, family 88 [Alteracholeplasma palmae J233]|uniref:(Glycosyl hydrolase, family 88) n=1 Tax=Alteracholeplasma palmae (strain ATCC 49389 / J233) TaxID=1318466 RepID=U4KK51_ALTPJ|nr:glycoside hydrolase family 88 protein [Alteracholeplasma palmae]CCV64024.1 (Glycosyl hydrolase, family 88 [Alteracholeplasma palmae J233]